MADRVSPAGGRVRAPATGSEPDDHRHRILIAEDNHRSRDMLVLMLRALELPFEIAENGAEAVALSERQAFGVAIFDIEMPEMSGVDAIRALRAGGTVNAEIPAIAISATYGQTQKPLLLDAGFDVFLPKPFTPGDLCAALQMAIEAASQRQRSNPCSRSSAASVTQAETPATIAATRK